MKNRNPKLTTFLLGIFAMTSVACVSSERYNALLAERDALDVEKTTLQQQVDSMGERTSNLEATESELAAKLAERDKEVNKLSGTYDQLVKDLKGELDSGKIRIEQLENGIRLSVDDEVLFPSGSAELDTEGQGVIKKVAAQVAGSKNRVEVIGHTDDRKIRNRLAERYPTNWELGGARAASVVRLLAHEGVDGPRLKATSLGEFQPIAPNDTDDARAKNRRIEIRLMPPTPGHTTLASD